jgi:hypothetical protein
MPLHAADCKQSQGELSMPRVAPTHTSQAARMGFGALCLCACKPRKTLTATCPVPCVPVVDHILPMCIKASRHQDEVRVEVHHCRQDLVPPGTPPQGGVSTWTLDADLNEAWPTEWWVISSAGRELMVWVLLNLSGSPSSTHTVSASSRNLTLAGLAMWLCPCIHNSSTRNVSAQQGGGAGSAVFVDSRQLERTGAPLDPHTKVDKAAVCHQN